MHPAEIILQGIKKPEKKEEERIYTPTEVIQAYKDAPLHLSIAIKELLDDDEDGGVFYAHIIQQACRRFTTDPKLPTAAVSVTDKITLYINPLFWMYELENRAQRQMVLKHEILHLVLHHCYRCQDFGNKILANVAADLVVNGMINSKHIGKLKERSIFPENYNLPPNETLPWYYQNFPIDDHPLCSDPHGHDEEHHQSQKSKGNSGSGSKSESNDSGDQEGEGSNSGSGHSHQHSSAVGSDGKCKVCGGLRPLDAHGLWDDEESSKVSEAFKRSLLNDSINRAANAAKNAGNLPSMIKQAIELARLKPQIPWELVLRQFVSKLSSGVLNHTKKRISKRFSTRPGIKIKPKLKVLLPIDVSGSISNNEYEIFLNEALSILKNSGIDSVDILEWDVGITSTNQKGEPGAYKLKKGYNVIRTGCGGTCPNKAIEWINENKDKYDGAIWMTDGYFSTNQLGKLKIPSLWVVTNSGSVDGLKDYRVIKLPQEQSESA